MTATLTEAPLVVFFSSLSGNTARFVEKLQQRFEQDGVPSATPLRIPLRRTDEPLTVEEPFVLVTPTYGGGQGRGEEKGAVPKQVVRFLNIEQNRQNIRGVISAGNTNFGEAFCLAGDIISRKCQVPHLYRLELFGTPEDVDRGRG
ncbi:MAG: class Ib ribonucleoside-diphosphate reductase assembly flavoprotein NrdI, partial [Microbacterium sp.]